MSWDSDRTGNEWAADGPEAGYFPFYLSLMMGAAALYGIGRILFARVHEGEVFVTREQLYRVMQVFVPSFLFCFATQYLGIYVASFILTAGFMIIKVSSKEEAIELVKRAPFSQNGEAVVEIRKLMDLEDFTDMLGDAFTPNEEIRKVKY